MHASVIIHVQIEENIILSSRALKDSVVTMLNKMEVRQPRRNISQKTVVLLNQVN